jgi:hypothetical protein
MHNFASSPSHIGKTKHLAPELGKMTALQKGYLTGNKCGAQGAKHLALQTGMDGGAYTRGNQGHSPCARKQAPTCAN